MWDFGFYCVTFAPYLRPHPLLWSPVLRFPLSIYHFSPPQPQFLLSFYLHMSLFPPLCPFISSPLPSTFIALPPHQPLSPPFWSVCSTPGSVLTLARFSSTDVQTACSFHLLFLQLSPQPSWCLLIKSILFPFSQEETNTSHFQNK